MKALFEQFSGTYHKESDYLIPNLALLYAEENSVGFYGQQHLPYWQYRRITYINLLISRNLHKYLSNYSDRIINSIAIAS